MKPAMGAWKQVPVRTLLETIARCAKYRDCRKPEHPSRFSAAGKWYGVPIIAVVCEATLTRLTSMRRADFNSEQSVSLTLENARRPCATDCVKVCSHFEPSSVIRGSAFGAFLIFLWRMSLFSKPYEIPSPCSSFRNTTRMSSALMQVMENSRALFRRVIMSDMIAVGQSCVNCFSRKTQCQWTFNFIHQQKYQKHAWNNINRHGFRPRLRPPNP